MESDDRFKHLATDPRFKTLRKKQKKVDIDERFQSMFTDERFTLKYRNDKRGRKQKKSTGDDLKKYYNLVKEKTEEQKLQTEEKEDEKAGRDEEVDDDSESGSAKSGADEDTQVSGGSEAEESDVASEEESDLSSSSDEAESEVEDPGRSDDEDDKLDTVNVNYNWQPLDHDAETAETVTKRLAIQNLDWDHLDVRDIYTLVSSIRPPLSVRIYVSEFGKERLAKEEIEGPKEIVEMPEDEEIEQEYNDLKEKMNMLKNKGSKVNEYVDADEEMDPRNEEIRERIRRYQLNRMKYYYAIAEFESCESADVVYKELDGMEYEGSSLELDLRFVPDDMEFDEADIKAECDKAPDLATYKAPQFINSALQQTTVKFTWDETDTKRQDRLRRAYTKEELERDDLEAYLASETDSESEEEDENDGQRMDAVSVVTGNSEARALKYKNLLKSLDESEDKKKKVDVDVEWGNYSEDEEKVASGKIGQDADDDQHASDISDEFPSESSDDDEPIVEAKKRGKRGRSKKASKRERRDQPAEEDDELGLLVMDNESKKEDFKFNPDDERFQAIYESGLYNIDPSHPNFKRTETFDMLAERKRQRRQNRQNQDK